MKKLALVLIFLVGILYLTGCAQEKSQSNSKEITIFAAASLKESLDEIKSKFEKSTNIKITLNLASSGTLQKQIEEGAPADMFISAGKKQMDILESKNLVDKDTREDLLRNRLVLIISKEYKDKIKSVEDLTNLNLKLSVGEPETVPAGQYTKESLQNMKLWDKLYNKMVFAKDVKQVVAHVESGEAAAGVVYNSDALALKNSVIVQVFDESLHKPIVYPLAIVTASKDKDSARAFIEYLKSDEALLIFKKYGFIPVK